MKWNFVASNIYRGERNFKTTHKFYYFRKIYILISRYNIIKKNNKRDERRAWISEHRARPWPWIAFYRMAAGKGQMLVVNGLYGSLKVAPDTNPPLNCLKFVYETKDWQISPEIRARNRPDEKSTEYFIHDSSNVVL